MPIDTSTDDVYEEAMAALRVIDSVREIRSGEPGSVEDLFGGLQDLLKGFNLQKLRGVPFEDILKVVDEAALAPVRAKVESGELPREYASDDVLLVMEVLRALECLGRIKDMTTGVKGDVGRLLEARFETELAEFAEKVKGELPRNSVANRREVLELASSAAGRLGVKFRLGREGGVDETYVCDVLSDKFVVAKYIECPHGLYAVVCNEATESAPPTVQSISILFASNVPGPTGKKCWSFLCREEI